MLNDDLWEITKWCCRNSSLINPDKTKLLVIGVTQLTKTLPPLSITLMGKIIEPVTTAKELRVYIDNSLNYNDHINKISSSCIFKLIMINRMKYLLDKKTILLLIHSFVFNKLLYCSSVWSNTSNKNIKKLQLTQHFAARIVLGLKKYDHISEGLKGTMSHPAHAQDEKNLLESIRQTISIPSEIWCNRFNLFISRSSLGSSRNFLSENYLY